MLTLSGLLIIILIDILGVIANIHIAILLVWNCTIAALLSMDCATQELNFKKDQDMEIKSNEHKDNHKSGDIRHYGAIEVDWDCFNAAKPPSPSRWRDAKFIQTRVIEELVGSAECLKKLEAECFGPDVSEKDKNNAVGILYQKVQKMAAIVAEKRRSNVVPIPRGVHIFYRDEFNHLTKRKRLVTVAYILDVVNLKAYWGCSIHNDDSVDSTSVSRDLVYGVKELRRAHRYTAMFRLRETPNVLELPWLSMEVMKKEGYSEKEVVKYYFEHVEDKIREDMYRPKRCRNRNSEYL